MLYKLFKLMKSFFQILNLFLNFWPKNKKIRKNSEAWILIKLQRVIIQWIYLNELYKLIKNFFQISFLNFCQRL